MNPHSSETDSKLGLSVLQSSGLSHSQVQIWAGQTLHSESPFCNMAFAFIIEGSLDEKLFAAAWQHVVDKSEALRSYIETDQGKPRLQLRHEGCCRLRFEDFASYEDSFERFSRWAENQVSTPLALDGELVRSHLCKISDNRNVWFLNQHHLITDAYSTQLAFKAVSSSYEALLARQPLPLLSNNSYYEICETLKAESQMDAPPNKPEANRSRNCTLYGKRGNPNTTKSERITFSLTKTETEQLRKVSEELCFASLFPNISLLKFLSALLSAYLFRASSQSLFGIDAPAGNRPNKLSKESIGCFIEMFPMEVEVGARDTFRTLAERQSIEVDTFLSKAAPGLSSPSGSNASNVVLNFFPESFGPFAGMKTHVEWIHSGAIEGVYDLKLQVHDFSGEGAFTFHFDLSSDTFSQTLRERIPQHFRYLLEAMIDNLDTSIESIDILTADERQALIVEYNRQAESPIPTDTFLHRFKKTVERFPEAIALSDATQSINYQTLWDLTARNASRLRELGADSDRTIVVSMSRSIEAVIAILSVLQSGAAFVPIDPTSPETRRDSILSDCGPSLALVDKTHLKTDLLRSVQTYTLEDLASTSDNKRNALPYADLDSLAYVIYTSGSTGKPKGVEIEHRGLIDYLDWAERTYVRGERLNYPLFTSLSFDLTITCLLLPFMTGGQLIVYPQKIAEVDTSVIDVINENAVDFLKLTPSHLSLLRKLDLSRNRISRLVLGGEDLKSKLADAVLSQFRKPVELYNEYGPTECVVGCMIHKYQPNSTAAIHTSVPIGTPADHVSIYLLNDSMRPVPEGVSGEIFISRNGIARGYRKDPDKTSKAFLKSPFDPGRILYRTGDLARFETPGSLTYLGRIDNQVKISGHRIELGEIEAALLEHPAVTSAFATVKSKSRYSKQQTHAMNCSVCGLSSEYPSVVFDENGMCSVCASYQSIKDKAVAYFESPNKLRSLFDESRKQRANPHSYDCMVFFSGGKDSAYALCQLVDMGLKVYAFTLDNGYLSEQAMSNIRRVVEALGVDHEFATTPAINEIFRDSLARFSNVCNGCFKAIYTLGINRAHELGIPIIVTGLSRGQFFETRLTEGIFSKNRISIHEVDTAVLEARKRYHRDDDAVSRCLDTTLFKDDSIFEEIRFVDFYRYWDAPLEEIYAYLSNRVPWIRPSDTGRSTNCRVNDVGIYIHKKERGYHNYSLPYSWDVRLGQKKREEALEELEDDFDLEEVRKMLQEIGYDENRLFDEERPPELVAYYESLTSIDQRELSKHLENRLPSPMKPKMFLHVEKMPLTQNGKIDAKALPYPDEVENAIETVYTPPKGPVEEHVSKLWSLHLGVSRIGANDSFFQHGGTSLTAMEVTLQLCQDFSIDLPLQAIFSNPTVSQISQKIEETILEEIEQLSDDEAASMLRDDGP